MKALQTNAYLKDTFGTVETRTTTRPDMTYTGTYLYGRETYLEAFPDGTFGLGTDFMGMALGDEKAGGIESVQDRWAREFGADGVSTIDLISRNMEYVPDAGKYGLSHSRQAKLQGDSYGCRLANRQYW